jgi:Uma2 family endonuclease
MGETDKHADQMIYCKEALRNYFAARSDVYVSGNNFVYYERGNPRAVVSPDVYVVYGVAKRQRDTYMVWKEAGILPAVVMEITSKQTRKEDTRTKFPLYEQTLGIPEYFQFDPTGDYLEPRLQGFRLVEGRYVPIALETAPLPDTPFDRSPQIDDRSRIFRLHSEQLGLDLIAVGQLLRFYDPLTGEWLLGAGELRLYSRSVFTVPLQIRFVQA